MTDRAPRDSASDGGTTCAPRAAGAPFNSEKAPRTCATAGQNWRGRPEPETEYAPARGSVRRETSDPMIAPCQKEERPKCGRLWHGRGEPSVPDLIDGPNAAGRDRAEVEVHAVPKAKLWRRASTSEHFEVASMLANIFGPMN